MPEHKHRNPGDVLDGKYVIEGFVGRGGMGAVYRARHIELGSLRAIKLMRKELAESEAFVQRFRNEARMAEALRHPNLVALFDFASLPDGTLYIAWEYVEGETLTGALRTGTRFTPAEVAEIVTQLAQGLTAAHDRGFVHRDISPDNIMLTSSPEGMRVAKLLDFGLAKETDAMSAPTSTGTVLIGKLGYAAPEQLGLLSGDEALDARADVFSLAVVAYLLLTGECPFRSDSFQSYLHDCVLAPEKEVRRRYVEKLPRVWQEPLSRALARDRNSRTRDMQELASDVRRAAGLDRGGWNDSTKRKDSRWKRAVYAIAAVLVLTFGGLQLLPRLPFFRGGEARSLAVLPFSNATGDPEMDYLSDGIAESIISSLSQVPEVKVISRASAFRYREPEPDFRAIGRELDVGSVLVGRLHERDGDIDVAIELVDATDAHRIWGGSYRFEQALVFAAEETIANRVKEQLRVELTPRAQRRLSRRQTSNPEAYRAYLRGRYHWGKRTERDMRTALSLFGDAIAADPNYALAHVGLADSYALLGSPEYGSLPPQRAIPIAKEHAMRALTIDESLGEAHAVLGLIQWSFEWDWEKAEASFRRAIDLSPGYATAHQWYSEYLTSMGRFAAAEREMQRAMELDPLSLILQVDLGFHYFVTRRFGEADRQFREALELEPYFYPAHLYLGLSQMAQGQPQAALREIEAATSMSGRMNAALAMLGTAYARLGQAEQAHAVVAELQSRAKEGYVRAEYFASIHAALGDLDEAFHWLEQAFDERSGTLVFLQTAPLFDDFRADRRFDELLARMRFAG